MGNFSVADRDPREMRDTANGGGVDGHYIGLSTANSARRIAEGAFAPQPGGTSDRRLSARVVLHLSPWERAKRAQASILLSRASAAPASARVSSAAGISRPIRTACPAQRLVKSTFPCFSAAAFKGPSAVAECGKAGASGEIGPTSRITRLATPRAGRPVMTLVMTVESSRAWASATRAGALTLDSGQRR